MSRLILIISFLGFVTTLVTHIAAVLGFNPFAWGLSVWPLHAGMFVVWFCFIVFSRKVLKHLAPESESRAFAGLPVVLPRWLKGGIIAMTCYIVINCGFLSSTGLSKGQLAVEENGRYLVQTRSGRLVRDLTLKEYTFIMAKGWRFMSGGWLIFYFIPFAVLTFAKKAPRDH